LLKRIYSVNADSGNDVFANFIKHQKSTLNIDSNDITLWDAVFGSVYGRATQICFVLNIFNQLTGMAAIAIYITRMLFNLREKTNGQFPISPFVGSYVFGVVNMTAAAAAIFPSLYYGRKPILLVG
jgi:hypothetical protein